MFTPLEKDHKDPINVFIFHHFTRVNDLNLNRAASVVSKQSRRSQATSKTYISKLEKQLEAEKQARLKLEQEVEEMKKINAEISSKLGLSIPSKQE